MEANGRLRAIIIFVFKPPRHDGLPEPVKEQQHYAQNSLGELPVFGQGGPDPLFFWGDFPAKSILVPPVDV